MRTCLCLSAEQSRERERERGKSRGAPSVARRHQMNSLHFGQARGQFIHHQLDTYKHQGKSAALLQACLTSPPGKHEPVLQMPSPRADPSHVLPQLHCSRQVLMQCLAMQRAARVPEASPPPFLNPHRRPAKPPATARLGAMLAEPQWLKAGLHSLRMEKQGTQLPAAPSTIALVRPLSLRLLRRLPRWTKRAARAELPGCESLSARFRVPGA